jgi:hypothetical protein
MRNPQQIKQAEEAWTKERAAWTKDSDAAKADKVVRPYDDREIINSGESWKD